MKRPQGFRPAEAPARRPVPERVAPARTPRPATEDLPRDEALTEPIRLERAVVRADAAPAASATNGTASARPAVTTPPSGGGDPPSGGGAAGDVRAARRALASAERRRRRYERQEVRRFTKRSRLRRMTWIVGFASVVVLALLAAGVAYSPLMALREIRVEGASRVPAADIRAAFDDRMGTPLPLIATEEVRRALSEFPLIETYSTETVPPGTLVVRIVERTPVGVVGTSTGLVSVDAAGVVIERVDAAPDGLPLVVADGGLDGDAYRAAGAVLRSLPADLRAGVARVTADTPDDVRLELAEGAVVVWGSAEESSLKATVLARLMAASPPDEVDRYDVSAPLSPVTD
ncbi:MULTISPECIES: FtsQ-type POTRA domain-containing protein [unclassified Agromyces]|uniref:FtsQ-type POTRA domain-containing protein n=1 Tax=unclassified Agromyces TaxID=2639701 RepID=UPI0030151732